MPKLTVIFDVDGTIADVEHRRHFVSGGHKNWVSFKEHTKFDTPVQWVCDIAKRFIKASLIRLVVGLVLSPGGL